MNNTAAPPGTQAVDRAALLIDTVVRADEPLTFLEIAESSGLPRSTTSRLLSALERTGLLERTETGSYVAGRLFGLYATRHDPFEAVVRLARPTMTRVGRDTGETVHLSVARNGHIVQVAQTDSRYLLGSRDWSQIEVPNHCSSLGKVLYAYGAVELPTGELARPTPTSIGDLASLERDLADVRRRGFAVTVDELEEGLAAVAAPVHGPDGDVVAALGISGPTQRLGDQLEELGRQLKDRAEQLSVLLGRRTRKEGVA
jgi:DNA-binding IclR family transcriptional regulator